MTWSGMRSRWGFPQDAPGWISGMREWGQSGDTEQSVLVSYQLSPPLARAGDTVPASRVLQQDLGYGDCAVRHLSWPRWLLCSGFIHSVLEE